ncbi:MAG: hypothetical protein VB144_06435 [Clostridia bacterium]|nr:hypothetical protein [Clostridia bacterium]
MPIPDVSKDKIIQALDDFDDHKRNTDDWRGWESRGNHRYAIKWGGKLYPVKEAIRDATGCSDFRGGAKANPYLRSRGFTVAALRRSQSDLGPDAYANLDRLLRRFAEYRKDEKRYLSDERNYKDTLFNRLERVWDLLYADPGDSKKDLTALMRGENVETGIIPAVDNLLGGFGYRQRPDFAVYLESISADEYSRVMRQLLEGEAEPADRLSQFRAAVTAAYGHLYDEGRFPASKKVRPTMSETFAAILLVSYDPESCILYRPGEYGKTAEWLGLSVPSAIDQKYAMFLDMSIRILAYAQENGYPVNDLLDVHNMIYVAWNLPEFEDAVRPPIGPGPADTAYDFIRDRGFTFPPWLVTDYILSLAAKPFVILSGISGTGKTKMAQLVADYATRASGERNCRAFVSVRPDWTDNSHLLGWYNAIAERYEVTPVLDLLMKASGAPSAPHFIILDEMNIAKVEHYFSDFLSCMESRWIDTDGRVRQERVHLHSQGAISESGEDSGADLGVPSQIDLPLNVCVTGTVNVDESTYVFSPKVLDRANVIEFNDVCLDPDSQVRAEAPGEAGFVLKPDVNIVRLLSGCKPATRELLAQMKSSIPLQFELLLSIHEALRPYHLHFGYRVAYEIAAFMLNVRQFCVGGDEVLPFAFDLQVMQKILPKMHGNAAQLRGPIDSLTSVLPESCIISHGKLNRMKTRLEQVGFASFIE